MKRILFTLLFAFVALCKAGASHPDSVYIFTYSIQQDIHKGLHLAWSIDEKNWTAIGRDYSVVTPDFGEWGRQKSMISPSVIKDGDTWYVVWQLGQNMNQFATTKSGNLKIWKPQDYPYVAKGLSVMNPILTKRGNQFFVTFKSADEKVYQIKSNDFVKWSEAKPVSAEQYSDNHIAIMIDGQERKGDVTRMSWTDLTNLQNRIQVSEQNNAKYNESMREDGRRFAGLKTVKASLSVDYDNSKAISDKLVGIFFEDISYAADGGIYAELIQNRDFEYSRDDRGEWNAQSFWTLNGDGTNWSIGTDNPLHPNNLHYAVLDVKVPGAELSNEGFDGIALKKAQPYLYSMFLKTLDGMLHKVKVQLVDVDNSIVAETVMSSSKDWKQLNATLKPTRQTTQARLVIKPMDAGRIAIDFVSLFPKDTFKNRKNGMRKDLAQVLADMHPRFIRFPGGCASHGQGLHNMYRWVNTVGPLWERKPQKNIWNYHQSAGMGFFEYFQLCEDLGAEPLPVLPAGICCQNSSKGGHGQQGGLAFAGEKQALGYEDLPTMEEYLQELLDLIEWANGDPKTSKWAKMRADAGHPKPFDLKYLGIGNEDLISDVFTERFNFLNRGIKAKHPEINVVGTVGPFFEGSDYEYGWQLAKDENVDIVDEHYYVNPGWYIHNQDFYDKYDRKGTKVYLGEWASRDRRMENALSEALHMTNLERNADVVVMSSYAPLFCNEKHSNWNPDLIYFNNTSYTLTPSYYVQAMCGQNSGNTYISGNLKVEGNTDVRLRIGSSVVKDENGDLIIKLVNLLPAEVSMTLNIGDLTGFDNNANVSVLDGEPNDRTANVKESSVVVSDGMNYALPRYSFTVMRIKNKRTK